jgi:biotin transport system substrate-specific component
MVDNCFSLGYSYRKRQKKGFGWFHMKLSIRDIMLVSLFTALMAAGAFIRIPFPLLPVTLQAFFCAFAGLLLGPRLGALSMAVYALLGLAGVPVFAQGGGITYIFNKSFGFILGFIVCAYIVGKLSRKEKDPSVWRSLRAVAAGLLLMYAVGIGYMLMIIRLYLGNTQIGLYYVVTANMPYFVKDAILFAVAALSSKSILPAVSRIGI